MILFKACPRCGGDIDTIRPEDVYCVQCSYRPAVVYPKPRIVQEAPRQSSPPPTVLDPSAILHGSGEGHTGERAGDAGAAGSTLCPRCGSVELIRLDKLRQRDNTCYRCRLCGHIFSPGSEDEERRQHSTAQ